MTADVFAPPPHELLLRACSFLQPNDFARSQRALGKRYGVSWQDWMNAVRLDPNVVLETGTSFHWCDPCQSPEMSSSEAYAHVALLHLSRDFIMFCFAEQGLEFPRHVPWSVPTFDEGAIIYAIEVWHTSGCDMGRMLSAATDYCIERRLHRALAATLLYVSGWCMFAGALKYAIRTLNTEAADMIWASRPRRLRRVADLLTETHWYSCDVLEGFPYYQERVSTLAALVWLRRHNMHARKPSKNWSEKQLWLYYESLTASTHPMALRTRAKRVRE